jgi:DNA-binding beta-propeller fold protein YncE
VFALAGGALLLLAAGAGAAAAATGSLQALGCISDAENAPGCAATADGIDYPSSVTVSPDGKFVYVGGLSGIVIFGRDTASGALVRTGCATSSGQTCYQGASPTVGSMVVTADGTSLYASGYDNDALYAFGRNPATGALTPAGCFGGGSQNFDGCAPVKGLRIPATVTASPDGRSVYVAGEQDNAIVSFKRDPASGALAPAGCIAEVNQNPAGCEQTSRGLGDPQAVAVTPDGRFVLVGASNALATFKRDTTSGALAADGCVGDGVHFSDKCAETAAGISGVLSLAMSGNGDRVYAAGLYSNAIAILKRDPATGAFTRAWCLGAADNFAGCSNTAPGLSSVRSLAVSADGKSVYGAALEDNAVAILRPSAKRGLVGAGCIGDSVKNPADCPTVTKGLTQARAVAVSPDGTSVYVAARRALVLFARDASSKPEPPPPEPGKTANVTPKSGTVLVRCPGQPESKLDADTQIKLGCLVDATDGVVTLQTTDIAGNLQQADFYDGAFVPKQVSETETVKKKKVKVLITELKLHVAKPTGCKTKKSSTGTASVGGHLWGHGKGHYSTRGRRGAGVVRGTTWLTEERCAGTFFKVKDGTVEVRDFALKRTVILTKGKSYLAR